MKTFLAKLARWLGAILLTLILALGGFLWLGNYHPARVETMRVGRLSAMLPEYTCLISASDWKSA